MGEPDTHHGATAGLTCGKTPPIEQSLGQVLQGWRKGNQGLRRSHGSSCFPILLHSRSFRQERDNVHLCELPLR